MFSSLSSPRVFALPVGGDFSLDFIAGLRGRLAEAPPEAWARVTIYVNTRRFQRLLLAQLGAGPACLLPDIRVISDIGATVTMPAAQSRFLRHLALADLVKAYLERQPGPASASAMFGLAENLADLQDELAGAGLGFDALEQISPQGLSGHWQRNLTFLKILDDYDKSLNGQMFSGGEALQRAAIMALVEGWQSAPPEGPVLLAGSTGSRATTALLMKAVAGLPQGAVILPGFDFGAPPQLWSQLGEEHPQFGFAALADTLGLDPAEVPLWHDTRPKNSPRNALLSLALRPAPVTPHWLNEAPALAATLPEATAEMTLLNAPDARREALAIAVCLRKALEEGKKSALVTPDRSLARRVAAQLTRWGIKPDDSAGQPAKLTPPGIFMRVVAEALGAPLSPVNLMEILKHPLCAATDKDHRKTHLDLLRNFEVGALRGIQGEPDLAGFCRWRKKAAGGADWLDNLAGIFSLMTSTASRPLKDWAALHRHCGEALSGPEMLWDKDAGQEVLRVFSTLALGDTHGTLYDAAQYRALFSSILDALEVREDPFLAHPDIAIWGTLEARVQSPDLLIAAGLNEGVWPGHSGHDPWLNREMRRQAGLMLPERKTGLSAHDFQQAMGAKEVILSRSLRDGEAPSVPSRWVMRLQNLVGGMAGGEAALKQMEERGDALLALAATLDRPTTAVAPVPRPSPAPPLSARPRKLSVTRIEALIRDPYAIYASHVLKLYPLDPLTPTPSPMMRGIVVHAVLERFLECSTGSLPQNPEALFDQCVEAVLADKVPWASVRALWRHHLARSRSFFIESERERRTLGQPFATEITGARTLKGREFEVTISAKADRIDIGIGGTALIYDYKAGNPVSTSKIKAFSVQLPLEGAIAEVQGFEGLRAAHVGGLALIYMGSKPGIVAFGPQDPVMEDVWQRVGVFLDQYQDREKGYDARLRPELIDFESDYDHLSRRGEWQDGDLAITEVIP
ncbi:MAG: double-strand break repair protein AddB [Rhodobacteraceae bacterium]|nr:double-strand break repair protein AddB [Paracoccaceae bacterium]